MEENEKYLIIYGYVLPMAIMLVWIMWRVCSDLKAGERYVSRFIRDCWPMLIPGVSLWGVCSLLLLASVECSDWLERHWGVWRMAGEQSRSIARRMLGGRQKECPNHQPLIKAEKETDLEIEHE